MTVDTSAPGYHALLSASKAPLWLVCTPSARLGASLPEEFSKPAACGTFAHGIGEARNKAWLAGAEGVTDAEVALRARAAGREFMNGELSDDVNGYVRRCMIDYGTAKNLDPNALVLIERRVEFDQWVPEGSGVVDFAVIADGVATVRDLKYGFQWAEVVDNAQLMILALGFVQTYSLLYDFHTVVITIDQPRRAHVDSAVFKVSDLLEWAETLVKPQAELAWRGDGPFVPGDHCSKNFCKARHTCRARIDRAVDTGQKALERSPLNPMVLLSDPELAEIGPQLDEAIKALTQLKFWMNEQTVTNKASWSTMKLVRGRRSTVIKLEPLDIALALGEPLSAVLETPKLKGITELRELAGGPKKFTVAIGKENIDSVPGRLTLVPATDKRPPWAPPRNAEDEFDDEPDFDS